MEDNMDVNYDEFFGAFDGDDGYQTDTAEETEDTGVGNEDTDPTGDDSEEMEQEAQDEPESGDTSGEATDKEADKGGAEGKDGADKSISEQKFTIKVNKESREVSLQEMTELAQKGADYDRTKGQLETERENNRSMQAELDKQRPILEILELAAEQSDMSVEQLLENVHVGLLKGKGMTEAEARAEIRAAKAEKQVKTMTEQQPKKAETPAVDEGAARAQREIAEFQQNFPGIQLTDELVNKLVPDVQKGMSLTNAYLKMENARKDAEIEELKRQQAANAQNKKNRTKTPGSMRDSGGQKTRTAEDDFFSAFEK